MRQELFRFPATNLMYGLKEAIDMLHEEGLDNVFARHDRHAEATRQAVQAWALKSYARSQKLFQFIDSCIAA